VVGGVASLPACRGKTLFFTTDVDGAIERADIIFVSVNTPTKVTGMGAGRAADLKYVESATRRIAEVARAPKIVVEKSTVPCKTAESMRIILESNSRPGISFQILSNPEFLAEGTAIRDLMEPDRVLIGSLETPEGLAARQRLADLYAHWVPRERIITMNLWSSELSKLVRAAYPVWWVQPRVRGPLTGATSTVVVCPAPGCQRHAGAAHLVGERAQRALRGHGRQRGRGRLRRRHGLAHRPQVPQGQRRCAPMRLPAGLWPTAAEAPARLRVGGTPRPAHRAGFGGSCFQKDILNLVYLCESLHLPEVAEYWRQVRRR